MKRKILIIFCLLFMIGCSNNNQEVIVEEKYNYEYNMMKNKLIEYGKLVFENDQWLNEEAVVMKTYMTLKDLSKNNGYDISMFINPETGIACDLVNTKIEFIINDVSDLENIDYEFNPILSCDNNGEDSLGISEGDNKYMDLSNQMYEYMKKIYVDVVNLDDEINPVSYKITLNELKVKGYDISMFVNPYDGQICDFDKTYGTINILGLTNDGRLDYRYGFVYDCN